MSLYDGTSSSISSFTTIPSSTKIARLANNFIQSFESARHLTVINTIDLTSNPLSSLSGLEHLVSLKELNLSKCKLHIIEWSFIARLNLEALTLDHNPIKSLQLDTFSQPFSIRSLSVSSCSLHHLNGLELFPRLSHFSADHNTLSSTSFSKQYNISRVSLSHNRIASLADVLFHFPRTIILNLENNAITDLNSLTINLNNPLEELNLTRNLISNPTKPLSAPNLKLLNLSYNRITCVSSLLRLNGLLHLNLSSNVITHLVIKSSKLFSSLQIPFEDYLILGSGGLFPNLLELDLSSNDSLENIEGIEILAPKLEKFICNNCSIPDAAATLIKTLELNYLREINFSKNPFSMFYYSNESQRVSMERDLYRAILTLSLAHLVTIDDVLLTPDDRERYRKLARDLSTRRDQSIDPGLLEFKRILPIAESRAQLNDKKQVKLRTLKQEKLVKEFRDSSTSPKSKRSKKSRHHRHASRSDPRRPLSFTDQLELSKSIVNPRLRSAFVDYVTEYHRHVYGFDVSNPNYIRSFSDFGSRSVSLNSQENFSQKIPGFDKFEIPYSTPFGQKSSVSLQESAQSFFKSRPIQSNDFGPFRHTINTAKSFLTTQHPSTTHPSSKFDVRMPAVPSIEEFSSSTVFQPKKVLNEVETWDLLPASGYSLGNIPSFVEPFISHLSESQEQPLNYLRNIIVNNALLSLDPLLPDTPPVILRELSQQNSEFVELSKFLALFDVELSKCLKLFDRQQYKSLVASKPNGKRFLGFCLIPPQTIPSWIDHGVPTTSCVFSSAPPVFYGSERFLLCVVFTFNPQFMSLFAEKTDYSSELAQDKDALVLYSNSDTRLIDRVYVRDASCSVFPCYVIEVNNL
ncbi:hypothetical protein RCL1_004616 [Eukaryota sp. TZLM3-RCL]